MGVAKQLGQATWYGLGPHECHWDRKFGALLRRYGPKPVESLHTPYIVPGQLSFNLSSDMAPPLSCTRVSAADRQQ